jgi:hypothetical protein
MCLIQDKYEAKVNEGTRVYGEQTRSIMWCACGKPSCSDMTLVSPLKNLYFSEMCKQPDQRKPSIRTSLMLVLVAVMCSHCTAIHSIFDKGHTVEVTKPRIHKSWYKKSRWHRRIQVGKFQLRIFEKSGVKKVKMRS